MSTREILDQIRSLPAQEKRELVEQISDEFGDELGWGDSDLSPEQVTKLERRLAEFERNPASGIPLAQVQAEMKQRFRT